MTQRKPLVAIVGRPNVGKSTLFNRLVGSRQAITSELAGTTRDRLYADGQWQGQTVTFIDTGGLAEATGNDIGQAVNAQVRDAVAEADLLLLVVDAQTGPAGEDKAIADLLRRSGKTALVVANKADNPALAKETRGLFELGLGEAITVSALHGKKTGDLFNQIITQLPQTAVIEAEPETDRPTVAIVGRPNVGKSTLFNQLAKREHRITSSQPNTTRDVGSLEIVTAAGPMIVLDTAGMGRKRVTREGIPRFSVVRTLRAINEADVVALLIDAEEGPTAQDAHIAAYAQEAGKALVLAVNKWDLVEKTPDVQEVFLAKLQARLSWLPSPPVVFVSALTGAKVDRLERAIYDVWEIAGRRIDTGALNRQMQGELTKLPSARGKRPPKLYYVTQVGVRPPTFVCFVNQAGSWADTHRRWLQNLIRDRYGLLGTPIVLRFKVKEAREVKA